MRLNCAACGNMITIDDRAYEDFEGPIKCNACAAILKVSIKDGKLKTMEFVRIARPSREEAMLR